MFLLLILPIIFLAGCDRDQPGVSGSFVGGDNGLSISFVDNEPPARVLDDNAEEFFVNVKF